jgi:hypothetical protein
VRSTTRADGVVGAGAGLRHGRCGGLPQAGPRASSAEGAVQDHGALPARRGRTSVLRLVEQLRQGLSGAPSTSPGSGTEEEADLKKSCRSCTRAADRPCRPRRGPKAVAGKAGSGFGVAGSSPCLGTFGHEARAQPAVGDLAGQREHLRRQSGQVDQDRVLGSCGRALRLASSARERDLVTAARVGDLLSGETRRRRSRRSPSSGSAGGRARCSPSITWRPEAPRPSRNRPCDRSTG